MVGIQFKPNVKITKRAKVVKFKISQKDLLSYTIYILSYIKALLLKPAITCAYK